MKSLYFILSVILLVSSCSEPIVDTFGNISGIVRDSRTNEPVEGVKITLTPTGASQVTDLEGSFLFDNLDPQEFTLMFTKTGFETTSQKVSVKPGLSTSVQVVLSPARQALIVTPEELDFGKVQNSIRITLENPASGSLNWSVKSSNSWLTVSQKSGTVSSRAYINAIVSRSGLAAGSYDGSLTFTVGGTQSIVPVSMSVAVNEKPSVSIEEYSALTSSSVTLSGILSSTGSAEVTSYGFCWSTSPSPTIEDNSNTLGDSQVAKPFEAVITGLQSETRYYFRAYAMNSVGVAYSGSEIVLTTKGLPTHASVTTGQVTDITGTGAILHGVITSLGNSTLTAWGHVWSTSPDPVLGSDDYTDGGELDELTPYTSELKTLLPNTTYYFRAYVINEVGISYGETVSFKTQRDESLNPTSGLYAYYTFENSTANTVEGAPNATGIETTYTTGVSDGYGLKLSANGESYLNIGEAMIDTQLFSISFWVKGIGDGLIFRVLPSSSARYKAISHAMAVRSGKIKYSQSGYNWLYQMDNSNTFPPFLHSTLNSSSWYHIAMTSDIITSIASVVAKLYINGEYVDTVQLTHEGSTNGFGTKLIFGGKFQSGNISINALSMTIDNLRIYNTRVLSAQEIRNIYNYEK